MISLSDFFKQIAESAPARDLRELLFPWQRSRRRNPHYASYTKPTRDTRKAKRRARNRVARLSRRINRARAR
jgi:hypothetical protein